MSVKKATKTQRQAKKSATKAAKDSAKPKTLSALDAAAKVLGETGRSRLEAGTPCGVLPSATLPWPPYELPL